VIDETSPYVAGVCDNHLAAARKSLILNGEMSEWLKEHAWKAILARLTERHRNTSLRNRFNDLPPPDAPRCDSVNLCIRRRFRSHLTQFLHSIRFHLRVSRLPDRRATPARIRGECRI